MRYLVTVIMLFAFAGNVAAQEETLFKFVFVLEPAVNAELNVTTWFRLNAGVSYRFVTGVTQVGLDNGDFSGPTATLTFKFGTF